MPKKIKVNKSFLKEFKNFKKNITGYMGIYSGIPIIIIIDDTMEDEFQVEYYKVGDLE